MWTDIIELIKVLGALMVPAALAYSITINARSKRTEARSLSNSEMIKTVADDVIRLEKNTNSISERNERIAQALGVTQGVTQERESVAATHQAGRPLPVADDRTAVAAERSASATERVANASEDIAKKGLT
jgi:hypothetical protein